MYPAIKSKRLSGEEQILAPGGESISKLSDFWRWAYSDLIGNAERGVLAEYIVACSLELNNTTHISWDKYDLLTDDGISVEVKTSAYIQTWKQKSLSKLSFGIQPTYGWDSNTNELGKDKKRQADIYVFCVHKHTEQDTINPLDISQWEFYLSPTSTLNAKFGNQKTTSLSALKKAGAELCAYNNLKTRIMALIHQKAQANTES